jgi:signal transduction histidine kinase
LLEKQDFPEIFEQNTRMIVRLNALLEMLFTLTRIEQNQIHLHKIPLNLREYFEEKRISKNIKNFEIIGEKTLEVDLASFDIICENLLNNAIKFGGENNTITVTLGENSFSIKDTGCGMSKENLEKIFQKFFRENTDLE